MSESVDILLRLIRLAIGTEKDYALPTDVNWREVCDLSFSQGVSSIAVDGLQVLMENNPDACNTLDLLENESLKYEWFASTFSAEQNYATQLEVVLKLQEVFGKEKLPFMIMKGIAISKYYPVPEHRECGDVDIYLGKNYKKSNLLLKENGIGYDEYYYRHSASHINGIMVENHCVLCDTRGPKSTKLFENQLEDLADKCLSGQSGQVYPSPDFNALFLPWHVSAHFAFERVTLRHLLDWALFIWKDGTRIDEGLFLEAQDKYKFGYSAFSKILTALSIEKFHIPTEALPAFLLSSAESVDNKLCTKVFDYMLIGDPRERDERVWKFRLNNVKRILSESWKYRQLYNMSALRFLMYKAKGVILGD